MLAYSEPAQGVALRSLIGIPFKSRGRDPAEGLDCWGLILHASRVLYNRALPDYPDYENANDVHDVTPLFGARRTWKILTPGTEEAGDVVVLTIAGAPTHAGLVIDARGRMLHTLAQWDSCIDNYRASRWRSRVDGFYKWCLS